MLAVPLPNPACPKGLERVKLPLRVRKGETCIG